MKHTTINLIKKVSLAITIIAIGSCSDNDIYNSSIKIDDKITNSITLSDAMEFYSMKKCYIEKSGTRTVKDKTKYQWFYQKEFIVDWQNYTLLKKDSTSRIIIDIKTNRILRAECVKENEKGNETFIVNVPQRLVIVERTRDKRKSEYILSLIPTKECEEKYADKVMDIFKSQNENKYSGIAIYTDIYTGVPVNIALYKNGYIMDELYMVSKSNQEIRVKNELAKTFFRNIRILQSTVTDSRALSDKQNFTYCDEERESEGGGGGSWGSSLDGGFGYTTGDGDEFAYYGYFPDVVITASKPNTSNNKWPETSSNGLPNHWYSDGKEPFINPGGGGSSNSSSNNNSAIEMESIQETLLPKDPCSYKIILSSDTQFRAKVTALLNALQNYQEGDTENGWIKFTSGEYAYPIERKPTSIMYSSSDIQGKKITEAYHSHPTGSLIPSYTDLKALATRYQNNQINIQQFSYGIISSMGCLSLVISSEECFREFAKNIIAN